MSEGGSQFRFYTVIEDLMPGFLFTLGLFPFLPNGTDVVTVGTFLPIVVGAWVVGRIFHSISMKVDSTAGRETHRDIFVMELLDPKLVNTGAMFKFYTECCATFNIISLPEEWDDHSVDVEGLPENWVDVLTSDTELDEVCKDEIKHTSFDRLETLYQLVRSYLHIDGRGRWRAFQAAHASFRSLSLAAICLTLVYLAYAVLKYVTLSDQLFSYTSLISSISPHSILIALIIALLWFMLSLLAWLTTNRFAKSYIGYLITDFLILRMVER